MHTGLPVRWTIIAEQCPTMEGDYLIPKLLEYIINSKTPYILDVIK